MKNAFPAKVLCAVLALTMLLTAIAVPAMALGGGGSNDAQTTEGRLAVTRYDDIGRVLYGFEAGSTVSDLADKFGTFDVSVTDGSGNEIADSARVGTGLTVGISLNGNEVNSYTSVVYGDINGDGKASSVDLLNAKLNVVGSKTLDGACALASDLDKDGAVDSGDIIYMAQNLLGIADIGQGTVFEAANEEPVKVLTIGDSLTDDDTWRYNFVKSMLGTGANFEMVGTDSSDERFDEFPDGDKYKGNCARGGYSIGPDNNWIGNVSRELTSYLSVDYDVVIIMLGRNSFASSLVGVAQDKVADNYLNLVNKIYEDNPNAVVICSTTAPMRPRSASDWYEPSDGALNGLNPYIPQIVNLYRDQGKHISWVDLLDCGLDYYDWPDSDMTHPLESGYKKIAAKWYDGAKDYILSANGLGPVEVLAPVAEDAVRYDSIEDTISFDFDNLKPVKKFALTDSADQALLTMNGDWSNGDWGAFHLGNNGGIIANAASNLDLKAACGDDEMYAFESHMYCDPSTNGSVLLYASYTDADNYIAGRFSPRSDESLVEVIKVVDGVETVIDSASWKGGKIERLGLRVDGTKVSVGVDRREALMDVEVGEMPNGYVGIACVDQWIQINVWNLYVPYADTSDVVVNPYTFTFSKANAPDLSDWYIDNAWYYDWGDNMSMAPYGTGWVLLDKYIYAGNYYAKYVVGNYVNDNYGSATLYLSFDRTATSVSSFQDATSTALIISPRDGSDNNGYTVTLQQRVNSAAVVSMSKSYPSQWIGEFTVEVYDDGGVVDIYCTDGNGNVTQWFDDVELNIGLGNVGFKDDHDDLQPRSLTILPIDDENVPARPVIVPAAGIELDKSELSVEKTYSGSLSASVFGENNTAASNGRVQWVSADTSIATVSNGTVTGVNEGTTTVTAIAEDGGFTDTCTVTVTPILPGDTPVISELPEFGDVLMSNNELSSRESWGYENTVLSGSYQIKFTVKNPSTWHYGHIRFNYIDEDNYYEIDVTGTNQSVEIYRKYQGTKINVYSASDLEQLEEITYIINQIGSQLEIARELKDGGHRVNMFYVDDNPVVFGKIGNENGAWGDGTRFKNLTVTEFVGDVGAVSVSGVEIDQDSAQLEYGASNNVQLTATVSPDDATNRYFTWSSSDTSVVTVDNNGVLTAVGVGTANIIVTTIDGGFTATCPVTVIPTLPGDTPVMTELPEFGDVLYTTQGTQYNELPTSGYVDTVFSGSYQMKFIAHNPESHHWGGYKFNYIDDNNYYEIFYAYRNSEVKISRKIDGAYSELYYANNLDQGTDYLITINQVGSKLEIIRSLPNGGHNINMVYIEDNTLVSGKIGSYRHDDWDGTRVSNLVITEFVAE